MFNVKPLSYIEAKKATSLDNLREFHRMAKVRIHLLLNAYNKFVDTILIPENTISEWKKTYSNTPELRKLLGKLYISTGYVEYLLNGIIEHPMFSKEEQEAIGEFIKTIRELPADSETIRAKVEAGDVKRFYDAVKTFYKIMEVSNKSEFKSFLETGATAYWEESGKEAIAEAMRVIVEKSPILFIRLMADYEKLIIESQEVSRDAEERLAEEKYEKLMNRVETMHAEFAKMLEKAQREVFSYKEVAERLKARVIELESERNKLIEELNRKETELEVMKKKLVEQIEKLKDAEKEVFEDKMLIASLKIQISDLTEKLAKYDKALEILKKEKEKLISENSALEMIIKETRERIEGKKEGKLISKGRAEMLTHMFKEAIKGLLGMQVDDITLSNRVYESFNSITLEGKKGFIRKYKAYVKAFVVLSKSDLKKYGYYLTAVSELDLKSILELEKAQKNEKTIIIIASPTGFTRNAIEFAKKDRTIDTVLILYDLESGEIIYNELRRNELPPGFIERIRISSFEELYRRFEKIVKEMLQKGRTLPPYNTYLVVEDFAREAGVHIEDAISFFENLESAGKGELLDLGGLLVFGVRL